MPQHPLPSEIKLHQRSRRLEITFSDGARFQFPCEYLRVYSPSAEVRGHVAAEWKLVEGKETVNILDLQPVGQYAVKIIFDDGHRTGLFDWRYLYRLGRHHQELWELYLERLRQAGKRRTGPDPFVGLEEVPPPSGETPATSGP